MIEKLYEGDRQIFVTTHSPTFVNVPRSKSVHQIFMKAGRSSVAHVDADSIAQVLSDIGVRNSDVLFSDAVVFVEGPGDRDVLNEWCRCLGANLAENNISVLPMGGGDFSNQKTHLRKEILEGIAGKAGVPNLFLFDRDERPDAEIEKVEVAMGEAVHFLQRRELENYLLAPQALLAAIKTKLDSAGSSNEKLNAITSEDIVPIISKAAENLYGLILLKRIRSKLLSVKGGGIFPREMVGELVKESGSSKLDAIIEKKIKSRTTTLVHKLKIRQIVAKERKALDKDWKEPSNRPLLAPGSELVEAVFAKFGLKYSKPSDTKLIASKMSDGQIPKEIRLLVKRIVELPKK